MARGICGVARLGFCGVARLGFCGVARLGFCGVARLAGWVFAEIFGGPAGRLGFCGGPARLGFAVAGWVFGQLNFVRVNAKRKRAKLTTRPIFTHHAPTPSAHHAPTPTSAHYTRPLHADYTATAPITRGQGAKPSMWGVRLGRRSSCR